MKKFNLIMFLGIFYSFFIFAADQQSFSYDEDGELHVCLSGDNWSCREVLEEDIPFLEDLFTNETIMKTYADGKIKAVGFARTRVKIWMDRFKQNDPRGALLVFNAEGQKIGFVIAGGSEEIGACELAYAYIPSSWGKGIGSDIVAKIVTVWAPEVKNRNYTCFGGKNLYKIVATASPNNRASWRILEKNGFHTAKTNIYSDDILIDYSNRLFSDYDEMEQAIWDEYASHMELNTKYLIIDYEGKRRAISKKDYGKLKYHFEYDIL